MESFMSACITIMNLQPVEVFIKLFLIYFLSGFIGLERASLSKPAGFRTHVLVGISAVLTVVCGEQLASMSGATDYSRIPAQLLSGIGFLGAGTILRDGFNVKGLTTAASLLAVTCIGLCVGAGLYMSAIIATAVVYVVLTHSHVISDKVEHYSRITLKIEANKPKTIMDQVQEIIDKYKIEVEEMKIKQDEEDDEESKYIKIVGKHRDEINKNKLISDFISIEKVKQVIEISE